MFTNVYMAHMYKSLPSLIKIKKLKLAHQAYFSFNATSVNGIIILECSIKGKGTVGLNLQI